jgi:HAD superfamily hydrolase (TIGR01509 family)
MPHDLIIYDCDGTLLDTETLYGEANLAALQRLGLSWTMDDYVDHLVGRPWSDGLKVIEKAYGKPLPPDFESGIEEVVAWRLANDLHTLPGVVQAVTAIDGPRCVASSTSLGPLRRNLNTAGLLDLFDPHVFSASQVARGKPHPDVFLFAAETMGVKPERCVVIEDSAPGVLAARAAGMAVVGFTGSAHDRARITARLKDAGAPIVIEHMDAWPEVVRALRAA